MKKFILTLGLVCALGLSTASCSTDDSAMETSADEMTQNDGNGSGDVAFPRPVPPRI